MNDKPFLLSSFSLFFQHNPRRLLTLFLITLFLGFNQGISILLLIPLLNLLNPEAAQQTGGRWVETLNRFMEQTGLGLSIGSVLLLFACCLIAIALLHYLQSVYQSSYQQAFSFEIRKRLYKKMLGADWHFLHQKSKFSHLQVLTSEIPKMSLYYYHYLGLATKIIFVGVHVALAATVSVSFTLLVAGTGILLFLLLQGISAHLFTVGQQKQPCLPGHAEAYRRLLEYRKTGKGSPF